MKSAKDILNDISKGVDDLNDIRKNICEKTDEIIQKLQPEDFVHDPYQKLHRSVSPVTTKETPHKKSAKKKSSKMLVETADINPNLT